MNDTNGTTPAPEGATPQVTHGGRTVIAEIPADLPDYYVEAYADAVRRLLECEVEVDLANMAESERLEREGCLERSWCTVENGGEHAKFHAGDTVTLAEGWYVYLVEERGGDLEVCFVREAAGSDHLEFTVPAGCVTAALWSLSTPEAQAALGQMLDEAGQ